MTAISTKELTAMRAVADDYFPDTCTIQTATEATGAMGGISKTWANTYTSVACRLDPGSSSGRAETIAALSLQAQSFWVLNIPYDQEISVEDRVIHNSITYEVVAKMHEDHSYATIKRMALVLADDG